mgnify:FL=1
MSSRALFRHFLSAPLTHHDFYDSPLPCTVFGQYMTITIPIRALESGKVVTVHVEATDTIRTLMERIEGSSLAIAHTRQRLCLATARSQTLEPDKTVGHYQLGERTLVLVQSTAPPAVEPSSYHPPATTPTPTPVAAAPSLAPPAPPRHSVSAAAPVVAPSPSSQQSAPATASSAAVERARMHATRMLAELFLAIAAVRARGQDGNAAQADEGPGGVAPPGAADDEEFEVPLPPTVDPLDPELQRRMYERIQQENVDHNYVDAMEYTPESFVRITMLYVPCAVNRHDLLAFVDSGAQMTVMGKQTAERCNIMHLLDRRMAGMAVGAGQCRILGRVHMTMVIVGGIALPMSVSVLENDSVDFIVGLDQLRRHQMCIDLKENKLRIDRENVAVPFLTESELPSDIAFGRRQSSELADDGTSAGPPRTAAAAAGGSTSDAAPPSAGAVPPATAPVPSAQAPAAAARPAAPPPSTSVRTAPSAPGATAPPPPSLPAAAPSVSTPSPAPAPAPPPSPSVATGTVPPAVAQQRQALAAQLSEMAQLPLDQASSLLEMCGWDIDLALSSCF